MTSHPKKQTGAERIRELQQGLTADQIRAQQFQVQVDPQIREGGEVFTTGENVTQEEFRRLKDRVPQEPTIAPELKEKIRGISEEQQVFKEIVQEPIISPEQENLKGLVFAIGKDALTASARTIFDSKLGPKLPFEQGIGKLAKELAKGDVTISQAEITMIEEDLKQFVLVETSAEIDLRIAEAEVGLVQMGLLPPVILPPVTAQAGLAVPIIGTAVATSIVSKPLSEFLGTDGQIKSLELALSQYNEMITIPARSVTAGLSPDMAFDKLNRMEEGINALESQLRLSGLTSIKVRLALRGRGVEARILKLKEKLQEGRLLVFQRQTQELLGEVNIPKSMALLRSLQDERKNNNENKS